MFNNLNVKGTSFCWYFDLRLMSFLLKSENVREVLETWKPMCLLRRRQNPNRKASHCVRDFHALILLWAKHVFRTGHCWWISCNCYHSRDDSLEMYGVAMIPSEVKRLSLLKFGTAWVGPEQAADPQRVPQATGPGVGAKHIRASQVAFLTAKEHVQKLKCERDQFLLVFWSQVDVFPA